MRPYAFLSPVPPYTLANADGAFTDIPTKTLKLMGEAYPLYTVGGGVKCYVVEARAKPDWLPNYYAPRMLYWFDQHAFFPLRIEQYGPDGNLIYVAVRLAALMNPALKERGYGVLLHVDWDISADLLSYLLTDAHQVHPWSAADQTIFFMPEFMTRAWMLLPVKSQAEVAKPEDFFLRPQLAEDRFPQERSLKVPAELRARLHAQEQAGRLVFTDSDYTTSRAALHAVSGVEENCVSGLQLLPTPLSGFVDDLKRAPHSHNLSVR